ncbi:hypothetical protein G6011_06059 [Alternaria panax]|uniref:Uncharacterized protein n=1 Tax=Alternaria panax TaxID=48097 RepID=A0AAD4I984_9PLEO|nr:hypothetical protein G6011_06059 [Alternaria panax]
MANPASSTMATPISFASGIGLGCAIKMAEAGVIVTIADRQDTAGTAIEELKDSH